MYIEYSWERYLVSNAKKSLQYSPRDTICFTWMSCNQEF